MNKGTKLRTALAIAIALYTALLKTDVVEFGSDTVNLIYQICMKVVTFVVIFLITYYNNDYTAEGAEGTGYTRHLKALKEGEIIGVNVDGLEPLEDGDEDE